ncbi:Fur-regulated basic protein FbpA [Priestia megaterium]|uniref:Fur-regulated basic protein FbpA n=1 Tax=Priestia megaterium TaxID=1404 RepID=UPI003D987C11
MIMNRNLLREAVEQRKDELKNELLRRGYFKTSDKRQLYELTLSELEDIYKKNIEGDRYNKC